MPRPPPPAVNEERIEEEQRQAREHAIEERIDAARDRRSERMRQRAAGVDRLAAYLRAHENERATEMTRAAPTSSATTSSTAISSARR